MWRLAVCTLDCAHSMLCNLYNNTIKLSAQLSEYYYSKCTPQVNQFQ